MAHLKKKKKRIRIPFSVLQRASGVILASMLFAKSMVKVKLYVKQLVGHNFLHRHYQMNETIRCHLMQVQRYLCRHLLGQVFFISFIIRISKQVGGLTLTRRMT